MVPAILPLLSFTDPELANIEKHLISKAKT